MSTQALEMASAAAREALSGTGADQMSASTPCSSWDVAALINHIVGAQSFFAAGLTGTPPAGETDYAAGDYVAAFDEASAALVSAFFAEGALKKMYELPFGTMPGSAFMGLATTDTFQHAWDLAKATGQNTDINPELAAGILAQSKMAIPESFRGGEGSPFGAEQQAPEGASNADQLAAFLGRTV